MATTTLLAAGAGFLFACFLFAAIRSSATPLPRAWILPAVLAATMLVFSLFTAWTEGPTGFWVEHTRNFWGNQIWFDLLLCASAFWILVVPKAKALGMRLPLWALLIIASGSIGLMAMLARMLWLGRRAGAT